MKNNNFDTSSTGVNINNFNIFFDSSLGQCYFDSSIVRSSINGLFFYSDHENFEEMDYSDPSSWKMNLTHAQLCNIVRNDYFLDNDLCYYIDKAPYHTKQKDLFNAIIQCCMEHFTTNEAIEYLEDLGFRINAKFLTVQTYNEKHTVIVNNDAYFDNIGSELDRLFNQSPVILDLSFEDTKNKTSYELSFVDIFAEDDSYLSSFTHGLWDKDFFVNKTSDFISKLDVSDKTKNVVIDFVKENTPEYLEHI